MSEMRASSVTTSGTPQPTSVTGGSDREFNVKERSQLQQALRRFRRHRLAVASLVLLIFIVLLAFVGPLVWKYQYTDITPDNSQPPSLAHPFGTDSLGHDGFAQVLRGLQQSIKVALCIALVATTLGVVWGGISGYYRGLADSVLMRLADLILTIPAIALAAALGSTSGGAWWMIALILGGLSAPLVARAVRGVVLSLREQEFIEAARALGASDSRIILRHLVPNALAVVIVYATLLVAAGILAETALSYVGFGVQAPDTSLGLLITAAQSAVQTRPWLFYFPGLFIILIALTVNFIGDGLRDALDPRQTRQRR
ncbi:ABC transporter permease [Planosporangium mesophilum]|uniref:Oligopeptide transport system permease protein OppC n=1 Tax=Planosporangium mesophilum TaxID=689768 RepID=A0A8J3TE89_9ACTN|nr:ABC transporter permease [Planosporangium mesophilum]NJC84968.1 ABC transporter permease [Planosporangium mesophilum]GII23562.1 ABC transporter permease [Planosporangium mesophilum]